MRQSRRVKLLLVALISASVACYLAVEWWKVALPDKLSEILSKFILTGIIILVAHLLDLLFLKQGLHDEIEAIVSKQMTLSDGANKRGLKHVYASREDAQSDILKSIREATKQIWIIAVVQKEHPNLEELLNQLKKKKPSQCTRRILLLDGCSPAAVIRTIMESPADAANSILNYHNSSEDETKKPGSDPYCNEAVYRHFEQNIRVISHYPQLQECIKFYDYTPLCLLVIAENTAFYQPYTFGSHGDDASLERLTGMNMPIFRFEAYTGPKVANHQDTFSVLVSHAERIWDTSDITYELRSDETVRKKEIESAFNLVKARIEIVYEAIHKTKKDRQRKGTLNRTAKQKEERTL